MRFCGYGDICWNPSNDPSHLISLAKANIEKNYPVVGILEELDLSMKVYEAILPQYLLGISQLYRSMPGNKSRLNGVSYKPPSSEQWEILSRKLQFDIEFYNYLRQRLHFQAHAFKFK
ncbi:hypothetical protein TCAL_10652 [Tigriopus californicus]|uniref:Uncharacterized protein n=1 Tax=Tigriopus californicus TaxID=6832 RepID=A0A553PMI1_TIGCA|nr:hypothetical protein TCAL_10652 [Tigriopus californicus]|eukprot:TCALIF_10652-PA protein Name:"Similar to hs2st1 Heparan sulfate 2-O-sulfotransferase 1 (Xenopus laevis)" AED:0.02 eAED:0.05 QI:0/-1/0/1/-1/1/1/0/117